MTPELVISIIACSATLLGSLALVAHRAGAIEKVVAAVELEATEQAKAIDAVKVDHAKAIDAVKSKIEQSEKMQAVFEQKLHDTRGEAQRAEMRSAKSLDDLKLSIESMSLRMGEVAVSLAKIETSIKPHHNRGDT